MVVREVINGHIRTMVHSKVIYIYICICTVNFNKGMHEQLHCIVSLKKEQEHKAVTVS